MRNLGVQADLIPESRKSQARVITRNLEDQAEVMLGKQRAQAGHTIRANCYIFESACF